MSVDPLADAEYDRAMDIGQGNIAMQLGGLCARHHVPAACVVTVDCRKGVDSAAIGCSQDSIFEAASLTKPVFAAGVVSLSHRGGIDLDRPLFSYCGGAPPVSDSRAKLVTARLVLSHRSGLPNWLGQSAPLMGDPGVAFSYSGEAYNYLQRVVEALVGVPLEAWLACEVLRPARMQESTLRWVPEWLARFAQPHDAAGRARARAERPVMAAGTLFSSPRDYGSFLNFMLTNHDLLEEMVTPHTPITPGIAWGLGWAATSASAFHWGDNPGYKHLAHLSPHEGRGFVVFTNSDSGWRVHLDLGELLAPADPAFSWLRSLYSAEERAV